MWCKLQASRSLSFEDTAHFVYLGGHGTARVFMVTVVMITKPRKCDFGKILPKAMVTCAILACNNLRRPVVDVAKIILPVAHVTIA